ncbi:pilus assembly FimT family protein [Corallococcus terminator]|uniref:Prepilin-type N-terminal cleavage/methylation domain-containing protein n=1 Tax=Corallococcus terminator TaxID=2316733 RepID=A0A3A8J3C0_9BACT|nr:prepilin-type N-terminal cleavage/methylation domain-containing protein [Corallococcus terminator]RKG90247.1 prepilin-type N-terminal cleavage/methylation domain-containing protein [Corallococcus terminator]
MKNTRGMTLLELMVVVAVLGIMVSLAVVNMQGRIIGQREGTATRELWSSVLRARQLAIATNQPVRFVVDADVVQSNGLRYTVARWERLRCADAWSDVDCPPAACDNKTCRQDANCCTDVGEDIVIPASMDAQAIHGLCFQPGSAKPVVNHLDCMRDLVNDAAAMSAATPNDKSIRFTYTTDRADSLLVIEPLTGIADLLECDSNAADANRPGHDPRSVAACTP